MGSSEDNDDRRSLVSAHVIPDCAITAEVRKAEIIWAIKTVLDHVLYNANSGIGVVFRVMFPNSAIAKKFSCLSTKLVYLITFGIAPYFTQKLVDKIRACKCYLASFDEFLNEVCQQGQMDINIRYFHLGKVLSQHLDSQFLGHSTTIDLLQAFKKGNSKLNPHKLLQELVNDRKRSNPEPPGMLQLGTCSLHTIHLAFSTANKDSGWSLLKLFRVLWYLFHGSPARREDFQFITKRNVLMLQFCSSRWVEDVLVAERAVEIWPNVVKYVNETLKNPKSTFVR